MVGAPARFYVCGYHFEGTRIPDDRDPGPSRNLLLFHHQDFFE